MVVLMVVLGVVDTMMDGVRWVCLCGWGGNNKLQVAQVARAIGICCVIETQKGKYQRATSRKVRHSRTQDSAHVDNLCSLMVRMSVCACMAPGYTQTCGGVASCVVVMCCRASSMHSLFYKHTFVFQYSCLYHHNTSSYTIPIHSYPHTPWYTNTSIIILVYCVDMAARTSKTPSWKPPSKNLAYKSDGEDLVMPAKLAVPKLKHATTDSSRSANPGQDKPKPKPTKYKENKAVKANKPSKGHQQQLKQTTLTATKRAADEQAVGGGAKTTCVAAAPASKPANEARRARNVPLRFGDFAPGVCEMLCVG